MDRILWKLDHISERLWTLARLTATQAAALANDGKGLAVVAEETRKMAEKVNAVVERAAFDETDTGIDKEQIVPLALMLDLLALNSAIESYHLGHLGKQAAVCAEDIRQIANELVRLFDKGSADPAKQEVHPWPKYPLTSTNKTVFLHFTIGNFHILESLDNIIEVCGFVTYESDTMNLRGIELPLIDCYQVLGAIQHIPYYVILKAPW